MELVTKECSAAFLRELCRHASSPLITQKRFHDDDLHVGLLIKGLSPPALLPLAQVGEDRLANQEQTCTTQLSGDHCPVATTRIHPQHCVENGIHHNELAGRLDRDAHEGAEGRAIAYSGVGNDSARPLLGSTRSTVGSPARRVGRWPRRQGPGGHRRRGHYP